MIVTYCLVIPHYNHVPELEKFLPDLVALGLPIFVVDDGSAFENITRLRTLAKAQALVTLIEHRQNRGKGAAVMTGFTLAQIHGFTHALQIDADGQHNLADVSRFIDASKAHPQSIICGKPVFDKDAPSARVYGRKVTDFWTALETLSLNIKDALCGFRIYPLASVTRVIDTYYLGPRMDFDTEILVKSVWQRIPLIYLETRVIYPEGATSHFHYLRDNLLLIRLHTRLMLGMLCRIPFLIINKFRE